MKSFSEPFLKIRLAALYFDSWTDAFGGILAQANDDDVSAIFLRRPRNVLENPIAVEVLRNGRRYEARKLRSPVALGHVHSGEEKGCVSRFDLDGDSYSILIAGAEVEKLRPLFHTANDDIVFAVQVHRALVLNAMKLAPSMFFAQAKDPAFVLDLDGNACWHNDAAREECWHPVFRSSPDGPLLFANEGENCEFRTALAKLRKADMPSVQVLLLALPDEAKSAVMVTKAIETAPLSLGIWGEFFAPERHAIAFIRNPKSKPNVSPLLLRDLYGLTQKEADLAVALARGESLREFANRTGVTFETVRWHSKKVFQKMDCSKQQDVMYTLLFSIPAVASAC
ncbi:regulatory protein LuxR [Rhodomicrobium vannielii ATCC 17100]|uniref:Regulatory protein LuxR n=1 Tax=Rhodomicrobium vannielii (strain ATCC 17100 / DSM 162 / LMG 4299 / NCIMB 10020 / ATH 3.1.1) TaxID=648757 RepID=E3HZP1_RHOVT|nr:LuxR C-terminal-related transcriptional regulator [Rhodomicrobium vannielii]ADP72151.1 regulatory protein LuxR [Rhodomicrobium vannielii ATCC 17100]